MHGDDFLCEFPVLTVVVHLCRIGDHRDGPKAYREDEDVFDGFHGLFNRLGCCFFSGFSVGFFFVIAHLRKSFYFWQELFYPPPINTLLNYRDK